MNRRLMALTPAAAALRVAGRVAGVKSTQLQGGGNETGGRSARRQPYVPLRLGDLSHSTVGPLGVWGDRRVTHGGTD